MHGTDKEPFLKADFRPFIAQTMQISVHFLAFLCSLASCSMEGSSDQILTTLGRVLAESVHADEPAAGLLMSEHSPLLVHDASASAAKVPLPKSILESAALNSKDGEMAVSHKPVSSKAPSSSKLFTSFEDFKLQTCPAPHLRHRKRSLEKRAILGSASTFDSSCPALQGGTDAIRNRVNGRKVNTALCNIYKFWSVLMWDPIKGQLFRDQRTNYPRDQYTCEHMVELNSLERGFRGELRALYASLEVSAPKLAATLCKSYATHLQTHFENIANDERNLQFVYNEMEKPKGAAQSAVYQDTFPAWEKYPIMKHFNKYDPQFALPPLSSSPPISIINKARSDSVDSNADSLLSSSPSSSSSDTSFASLAERMKDPQVDLASRVVDIPVSPNGHFLAAHAYLDQAPTGLSGYRSQHLSISEAHQVIGRDMEYVFGQFAAIFTCNACSPEEAGLVGYVKQRIHDIGVSGNVFLNGGVVPADGTRYMGRVEGMKHTLGWIEQALRGMGARGEHVTQHTVIQTAINC